MARRELAVGSFECWADEAVADAVAADAGVADAGAADAGAADAGAADGSDAVVQLSSSSSIVGGGLEDGFAFNVDEAGADQAGAFEVGADEAGADEAGADEAGGIDAGGTEGAGIPIKVARLDNVRARGGCDIDASPLGGEPLVPGAAMPMSVALLRDPPEGRLAISGLGAADMPSVDGFAAGRLEASSLVREGGAFEERSSVMALRL